MIPGITITEIPDGGDSTGSLVPVPVPVPLPAQPKPSNTAAKPQMRLIKSMDISENIPKVQKLRLLA